MTIEKFKSFKGCENHTDGEAKEIIESLRILATILLNCSVAKPLHIDNQQVVSLLSENKDIKIKKLAA